MTIASTARNIAIRAVAAYLGTGLFVAGGGAAWGFLDSSVNGPKTQDLIIAKMNPVKANAHFAMNSSRQTLNELSDTLYDGNIITKMGGIVVTLYRPIAEGGAYVGGAVEGKAASKMAELNAETEPSRPAGTSSAKKSGPELNR